MTKLYFADKKVEKSYSELKYDSANKQLYKFIKRALEDIKENPECGISISKKLIQFSKLFNENKLRSIHFGKQDIRGGISITLTNKRYCVPYQKFFSNKSEMLGFVCGFVCAMDTYKPNYSEFGEFLK